LVSRLVEIVGRRILKRTGFDKTAPAQGPADTSSAAAAYRLPSHALARTLYWIVMLTFGLFAIRTLEIRALNSVVERLIAFIPDIIAAVAIVAGGMFAGKLVKNVVGSAATAADIAHASRLGSAANTLVVVAFSILAIEQLGVKTEILVIFAGTVIMAIGLTMGVAFALGARPVITHILAGHYMRRILQRGRLVEIEGRRGEVEQVGPVHTVFRDDQGAWSVANARLLEETMKL
jgi:hypothetical protein